MLGKTSGLATLILNREEFASFDSCELAVVVLALVNGKQGESFGVCDWGEAVCALSNFLGFWTQRNLLTW